VTLPDLHLAEEALAAYVDGVLSSSADERAARHLRACAECREAVDAGREAKVLLAATPDPELPAGLMARLLDVPMTADLGATDGVLAFDGTALGFCSGPDTRVVERRATAPARRRDTVRPAGSSRPAGRSTRIRRTRRGLAVSLAGLAFGVIASAASGPAAGTAAPRPGDPGATPAQRLVVGTGTSMDLSRTFLFRRPAATPTLVPSAPTP
jgi:hypothetical protein